ncbi:MAG: GDSL-type esterase/lipase family protein [Planctomycetaceae bacterium]|nr:GDSL-type esterase/lipase family protein [Planctomycetaceae bacterium]
MSTKMLMTPKRFCRCVAGLLILSLAVSAQAANKAVEPVDRKDGWWVKRQAENTEQMNKGDVELLLIGDSITHGWDKQKELYDKFFGKYKPINLGFGGDQTQHVLWRLDHLPLDKIQPKVAQIMIGTNNIGTKTTTPKEAAEGIAAIVKKLQTQYPKLQIIVLKVFPRDEKPDGERRKRVEEINSYLPAMLKGLKNVELVDINAGFLDKEGNLPKTIMKDFLHPGKEGYEYWGGKVEPLIKAKFAQYDAPRDKQSRRGQRILRPRNWLRG